MNAILSRVSLFAMFLLRISAQADVVDVIHESNSVCDVPCERAAVVFIYELMGSKDTWQNGAAFWPNLLANDPDVGEKVDFYRVDFDSYLFSQGPSLVDVLIELQANLDNKLQEKNTLWCF